MSDYLQSHGLYSPWNSLGQNIGVDSYSLPQGIIPTQGSNPGLLHYRQILYQLSPQGSPRILGWVAVPFSKGSSWPRNQAGVSGLLSALRPQPPPGPLRNSLWLLLPESAFEDFKPETTEHTTGGDRKHTCASIRPPCCVCRVSAAPSCPTLRPCGLQPARLLCPRGCSRPEHWRGLPPPGILPTQGSNPGLPHCRRILCQLSYPGSPMGYIHIKRMC